MVDFDSRIGRHRPEVSRRRLTSASERSTPTSPSTRMGRACGEQGPWGEIKLFNLERWRTRVSKVSSSSFFEGPRTRVSKVSSSSFFEGPPPRLKSWNSHLGARGVPLGDKSGLVADWPREVEIWERAAHLKVEQGKRDQGLVDFDSRIGRHRPWISRRRLISASERSTPTSPSTRMCSACGEQGLWSGNQTF